MKNQSDKYLKFGYIAGLSWLNVFVFFKLLALAANFARIYTSFYGQTMAHLLMFMFAAAFFLNFRNLTLLAVSISRSDNLEKIFKNIALITVLILFVILGLQTFPEYLLTVSYQNQP